MDELSIRSMMHEALDAIEPPPHLRALNSVPSAAQPTSRATQSLRFEWALGVIAALLAIALVAGLLYAHSLYRPAPSSPGVSGPHRSGDGGMTTPAIGWTIGPGTSVLRTADGGAHWTDVTPPGYSSNSIDLYYLDGEHAWITEDVGATATAVLGTTDGGATWLRGTPVTVPGVHARGPKSLFFLDASHGWLLGSSIDPLLPGVSAVEFEFVYGTTDGGAHWKRLGDSRAHRSQCPWASMVFSSYSTGWVTTFCGLASGQPEILVSHDGGATWRSQTLPATPAEATYVSPPEFFDPNHGILTFNSTGPVANLLVTSDGGVTWVKRVFPDTVVVAGAFIDPRHGWVISGSSALNQNDASLNGVLAPLYRTDDGGATWTRIQSNLPLITPKGRVVELWFVTEQVGFAVAVQTVPYNTIGTRAMFVTRDGGKSWNLVGPIPSYSVNANQ